MMVEPGLDKLLPHVDSKYTLVSVSSKRARKIMARGEDGFENSVTLALQEIAEGKIEWERTEGKVADECIEGEECTECEGSEDQENCAEEEAAVETEEMDD